MTDETRLEVKGTMQLGATFPQTEIGEDPGAIRAYAQAIEGMGFDYTLAYDHVVGVDTETRPDYLPRGRRPPYTKRTPFHEPMVLFAYLAGITTKLGLVTGIIILPQRQTVLVAKQAAEIDLLSGGRLRLGIGTGWNEVEYEALGMNFRDRGARSEEQIALMRELWTKEAVTFQGKWHTVNAAGINPLPIQRPIPIFLGGAAEAVVKRVATTADGWFINGPLTPENATAIERMRQMAREAGRDPAHIGIEGSVRYRPETTNAEYRKDAEAWRAIGASHVTIGTMDAGLKSVEEHLMALIKVKSAVGPI
jgi:probable F420-dependent oxidoreductase